ncbi:MAG TPA: hypothetical protein VFE05_10690 [Longimicrobiaceae bacterium]|jgi:hypothetical protein|nr:hypothetical protein [Longimicrobiaceae bacterium]
MKKLALNTDDLNVETFRTAPEAPAPRGTVQAHATGFTCGMDPFAGGAGAMASALCHCV